MSRVDLLRDKLEKAGKIPYVISDMSDIYYISNFTGSMAYIVITEERNLFITDGRYGEQIKTELTSEWDMEVVSSYKEFLLNLFNGCPKVFVTDKFPLALYILLSKKAEIVVDEPSEISFLRMIKEPEEIELIKSAYTIASEGLMKSLEGFNFGCTEKQWAAVLEYNMKVLGAEKESFDTIVASGYRSALPHGRASDKIIDINEPVIVDYGAKAGYVSDITRMVYFGDDKDLLNRISIISDTIDYCIEKIRVGEVCSQIYSIAKRYLAKYGLDIYFNHGLGHSIGIDVHEKPALNANDNTIIQEGMVFTIEPGIYFSGRYGIRVEETVLVTKNGCEIISSMLKNRVIRF
ncbi:MAG: Xaa-Pro peptidase family protein [Calditerrivibrio sp.]|nr:Xaa-Pro peptidase family protein [Calditerrivibrio sp.]